MQSLAALRGKEVLLNFWVTPSANCQDDLKAFNRVYARWSTQGLRLLTVNVDFPANPETLRMQVREQLSLIHI